MPRNSASPSMVVTPGVSTSSGAPARSGNSARARNRPRDLEVGRVVAVLARDERVLARPGRSEEVEAELPAHDPALRLDVVRLEAAALEDPLVRLRGSPRSSATKPSSSRSNEYASFMMNSRTRSRPPRGRGSSRSFVWKWYQSCGSSLYDWISRAWKVAVSSCVTGRMKRRPRAVLERGRSPGSRRARSSPRARRA